MGKPTIHGGFSIAMFDEEYSPGKIQGNARENCVSWFSYLR